ncbi:mechanosensitive ion channel family protein [Clostridium sartagoforme]|uniref:Mechanosensitive ion channel family protein n=1 Tax=Clostridium sartagoforme TaxID=84031 RepID=A0A4S2DED5_9CLOT|nr:mechanosensitive ion channel family protein [Clostridium sartagoforme]TGY40035.1 mechanosensitive ion channel family protein [Clostridium sartagoforme]
MTNILTFINTGIEDGKIAVSFNWEQALNSTINLIEFIVSKTISMILLIMVMFLIIKIGNKIIDKFVKNQINSKRSFSMDTKKALTVGAILKSSLKYIVYFSGAAIIIGSTFKVSAAVLSAVGFVVGIGAQSLVKDIINGFFIIFEDQYGVGDHVTIGVYSGIVENIGIRATTLKDFSGDIHNIPNGSVLEVTNHSRYDMRFIVDVEIAYEEDIDNTINIITNTCKKFQKSNSEDIREDIEVLGAISLNASGVTIRVVGKSKPLSQWKMERELRKEIKKSLDEAGVEIPYPKTQLVNNN